jgi:hypothetical protein
MMFFILVDFPSCPKQMKLLTQKTLQAQGLPLTEEEACEGEFMV